MTAQYKGAKSQRRQRGMDAEMGDVSYSVDVIGGARRRRASVDVGLDRSTKAGVVLVACLVALCMVATTAMVAVQFIQAQDNSARVTGLILDLGGDIKLVQSMANNQSARTEQLVDAVVELIQILIGKAV